MKKSNIFWQTYLNLEKEAIEVSKYIFFTDEVPVNSNGSVTTQICNSQIETFSPYIADLLMQCCVQIEAISKELYFDNGGTKASGDKNIFFDEDCLKLVDKKWCTHEKTVLVVSPSFNFTKDENRILRPLKEAHKRQGAYWEKAYQAVKHDRYTSLHKGNIKALLHALAALYLLNIYYRNDSWITNYQNLLKHDFSMGSAIFSISPPDFKELWYGNSKKSKDSPYVVRYQLMDYQRIEEMQQYNKKTLRDYLMSQPEFNETAFCQQLQEAGVKAGKTLFLFFELEKYRLNKKFPKELPFVERKRMLVCSDEWNSPTYQKNVHLKVDDLTEDNIQQEFDSVGKHVGLEKMTSLQNFEWTSFAMTSALCKVCIE